MLKANFYFDFMYKHMHVLINYRSYFMNFSHFVPNHLATAMKDLELKYVPSYLFVRIILLYCLN